MFEILLDTVAVISIHAPARGATTGLLDCECTMPFQFTPPRGGRLVTAVRRRERRNFNSRPRAGGDRYSRIGVVFILSFQFTPPRGGRLELADAVLRVLSRFQFTPPRGGRPARKQRSMRPYQFQFTPPRGGRHLLVLGVRRPHRDFNSRPRAGGDM